MSQILTRAEITNQQMALLDDIYDKVTSADYDDIDYVQANVHLEKMKNIRAEITRELNKVKKEVES